MSSNKIRSEILFIIKHDSLCLIFKFNTILAYDRLSIGREHADSHHPAPVPVLFNDGDRSVSQLQIASQPYKITHADSGRMMGCGIRN
jgi:hypothetical protein